MSLNPSYPLPLPRGVRWGWGDCRCGVSRCWGGSHGEQGQGAGPSWDPKTLRDGQMLFKERVWLQRFWLPARLTQLEKEEELYLKVSGGAGWRRASLWLPVLEAWGASMFSAAAPSFSLGS